MKAPSSGSEIRPGSAFEVQAGDFLYSRLFAWKGSFEIVGAKEEGCVVSGEFPTFVIDREKLDPRWLRYWLLSDTGMREVNERSAGSTPGSRNRLREDRFLDMYLPLPSVDEQRRIADRLDALSDATCRIWALSEQAAQVAAALSVSSCARPHMTDDVRQDASWRQIELGSVMTPASNRVPVVATGSYPNLGIYSFGRGVFKKEDIDGTSTSATSLNRVCTGQFIYSRLFAFEGAYTYVPSVFNGYFVSNEFPTFDPHPDHLDARWLANYLRSPDRWAELAGSSKGLGVRRQRVPVEAVLAYKAWIPPIEQQRMMVQAIGRLEAAQAARSRTQALARSVVPAALNRAFAGLT